MKYVATAPIRFDKNYAIGDTIPDEVIDTKRVKRLIELGKISEVDVPVSVDDDVPKETEINLFGLPITEELLADFENRFGILPNETEDKDNRVKRIFDLIMTVSVQPLPPNDNGGGNTPPDDDNEDVSDTQDKPESKGAAKKKK